MPYVQGQGHSDPSDGLRPRRASWWRSGEVLARPVPIALHAMSLGREAAGRAATSDLVEHRCGRANASSSTETSRRGVANVCGICSYSITEGKTVLLVIDGQHTAIAASSNPNVQTIPVMIVDAPETTAQAAAFVGQNTDRIAVSSLHLFQASLIAGDEDALTVDQVCQRAGVRILKSPPGTSKYGPGETTAIVTIERLVRQHTAPAARRILEVLAKADLAPITGHHIRAAEFLMCDKDHRSRFEPEDLSKAIGELFLSAEDEAKALSHAHRWPFWKGLAVVWFRKTRKKRIQHLRVAA